MLSVRMAQHEDMVRRTPAQDKSVLKCKLPLAVPTRSVRRASGLLETPLWEVSACFGCIVGNLY